MNKIWGILGLVFCFVAAIAAVMYAQAVADLALHDAAHPACRLVSGQCDSNYITAALIAVAVFAGAGICSILIWVELIAPKPRLRFMGRRRFER